MGNEKHHQNKQRERQITHHVPKQKENRGPIMDSQLNNTNNRIQIPRNQATKQRKIHHRTTQHTKKNNRFQKIPTP